MKTKLTSPQGRPQKILDCLKEIANATERLLLLLEDVGMAVDDVWQTLNGVAEDKPEINAVLRPGAYRVRRRSKGPPGPELVARSVELRWEPRSLMATIDGRTIRLPRLPGLLLEILVNAAKTASLAGRDGWRSRQDIIAELSKQIGTTYGKRPFEQVLHRLRTALRLNGRPAGLIQSGPGGLRFALERPLGSPAMPPSAVADLVHQ
jgi:hypothetical protein